MQHPARFYSIMALFSNEDCPRVGLCVINRPEKHKCWLWCLCVSVRVNVNECTKCNWTPEAIWSVFQTLKRPSPNYTGIYPYEWTKWNEILPQIRRNSLFRRISWMEFQPRKSFSYIHYLRNVFFHCVSVPHFISMSTPMKFDTFTSVLFPFYFFPQLMRRQHKALAPHARVPFSTPKYN